MKSVSLITLLCFCCLATVAQQYVPMPTGKAIWNYRSSIAIKTTPTSYYYNYFLLIQTGEDTTINSVIYKKIVKRSWDTTVKATTYTPPGGSVVANHPDVFFAGLRENNRKVYIYHYPDTAWRESLLYDFTVSIGDTVPHRNFFNWVEDTQLVVKTIDSIQINGAYRKRYHAERVNLGDTLNIIEGIGSDKGLISYLWVPWCTCVYDFQCFTDSITSFQVANSCAFVWPQGTPAAVAGIAATDNVKVYPVPFSNIITIEAKDASVVILYNMLGIPVLRKPLDRKTELHTSDLSPGIYFLKLTDVTGAVVHMQRLVKE